MIKKRDSELSRMAPHAEREWLDDFVVEQRMLGVPGTRIGDALATVDAHLADTGESAADAFGPPKEYARVLAESEASASSGPGGLGATGTLSAVLGLAGIVLLPRGFAGWLDGTAVTITRGDLLVAALIGALTVVLILFPVRVLRFLIEHKVAALLVGPVLMAVFVAGMVLWQTSVMNFAWLPVTLVALFALLVSTVLSWRDPLDLLQTPNGSTLGSAPAIRLFTVLMAPLFALLMCALAWVARLTI